MVIDRLIMEYCPNGVEYMPLGEVCDFRNGFAFKSDLFQSDGSPIVRITNITGSGVDMDDVKFFHIEDYPKTNMSLFEVREGDILVAMSGATTGKIGTYKEKETAYLNQRTGKFLPKPGLNNRFLYHFLLTQVNEMYRMAGGGAQPNLSSNDLKTKIEIPIPPLPVQEEIVRILDTFTELQAELQAELQKRLQQYNYYRDKLLSFDGRTDVEWVTIDHLFHRKNGYTPSKANPDFWRDGTIPWFRMEDIRENGRVLTNSIQKVHASAVKRNSLVKAGSIILATSATIGEHALVNVDCLTNQRFTCLTIKEEHKHRADIKFLFYYMFKVDEWCKKHTVQGNFPGVDMSQFPYVSIPLPPLNEQKNIASTLDRFDSLTNDLSKGLPAEIEKRRQQYEYYRDKLLTFKRKEV